MLNFSRILITDRFLPPSQCLVYFSPEISQSIERNMWSVCLRRPLQITLVPSFMIYRYSLIYYNNDGPPFYNNKIGCMIRIKIIFLVEPTPK